MKKILFVMYRKVLAEALQLKMQEDPAFSTMLEYQYANAELTADAFEPDVVLVEIPESGAPTPEECVALLGRLRKKHAACRMLLLCPERNEQACQMTLQAVRDKQADDFVYYDTSVHYLFSKLATI